MSFYICYVTGAGISVPQVGGGSQADKPAHAGFDFPQAGASRPNFSEYNSPRVGIMNLPVKMDNVPKMKGSFDLYAVQLRTFLNRMNCWEVVDGTLARWDPTLHVSFVTKDNIAREAILSGVSADDAEMICQEETAQAM